MLKKNIVSLCYAAIVVSALTFSGGCVPKKTSPSDNEILHRTTQAALEDSAATTAGEDDDEDGAWEADTTDQSRRTKYLAKNYSRSNVAGTGSTGDLLKKARTALGTPYVRGGTSRSGGFDCSGFVQWSYNHVGIQLPRTAREQSQVGRPVSRTGDIQAGDIVAFRHPRRGYHTGIYVGDGKFIHSPRKRNVVRINSLDDPYFSSTFMGARRLNVSNEGDIEAAEKMLAAYANQPPPKKVASRSSKKDKKDKKSSARASARNSKNDKSKASATKSEKTTKVKTVALKTDKAAKKTSPNKEDKASSSKDKKTSKSTAKKTEKKKS